MARTQFLKALSVQEAAYQGFTHMAVLRAGVELTESTVNTAQTFKLGTQRVGEVIRRSVVSPITVFQDISDAAYNTTTLTVKTLTSAGADKTVLHTALELNVNGTEITTDQVNNTPTVAAASGDTIVAVVGSMAAKSISNLDAGVVHIYFEISAPIQLAQAVMQPLGLPQGFATIEDLAIAKGQTVEEAQADLEKTQSEAAAAKGEPGGDEAVNYEEMTVAELKELAKKRDVKITSDMTKDDIIEALEDAETAKA